MQWDLLVFMLRGHSSVCIEITLMTVIHGATNHNISNNMGQLDNKYIFQSAKVGGEIDRNILNFKTTLLTMLYQYLVNISNNNYLVKL